MLPATEHESRYLSSWREARFFFSYFPYRIPQYPPYLSHLQAPSLLSFLGTSTKCIFVGTTLTMISTCFQTFQCSPLPARWKLFGWTLKDLHNLGHIRSSIHICSTKKVYQQLNFKVPEGSVNFLGYFYIYSTWYPKELFIHGWFFRKCLVNKYTKDWVNICRSCL